MDTYLLASAIWSGIAILLFGWRGFSWVRAYDRHYPLSWFTIARQWAGLTVRAGAWPLVALGAMVGDAIEGGRWIWNHRSGRKRKSDWEELGRKHLRTDDGAEEFIYLRGPGDSTPTDARLHCGVKLHEPCRHDQKLIASHGPHCVEFKAPCCMCGKPATRVELGEPIDVTTDREGGFRRFVPGLKTGWCDEHDPRNEYRNDLGRFLAEAK